MKGNKGKLTLLFEIFLSFFKMGCFCFGGGYAAVTLIEREVVEEKKWLEREQITDVFAVAQSLPGAIALNSAGFVGYSVAGIPGAIAALIGNLAPSVFIMIGLSMLFTQFNESPYVQKAFSGIRPVVVGLILYAGYKISKTGVKDVYGAVIAMAAFVLAMVFHVSVIFIILGGIGLGIVVTFIKKLSKTKQEQHITKEDE